MAKWKQAGSGMKTNGTDWKQNGCFVSKCFHCFFPQPARIREEACYAKLSKNRKKDHIYGYVFNATFDRVEERWNASQFMNLKADLPFFETALQAVG